VQHDLLALMQQDSKDGAEDEDRDVGVVGAGLRLEGDVASIAEQEARHIRNAQQEAPIGDLPGRARRACALKRSGHRLAPYRHVGRPAIGRHRDQSRQGDLAAHGQPGYAVKVHCFALVQMLFAPAPKNAALVAIIRYNR
jgi:hypothetical protein